MAIDPEVQAVMDDLISYLSNWPTKQALELQKVIRVAVIKALEGAGYDMTNRFNLRVAYGFQVEAKMDAQYNIQITVSHKIDRSTEMTKNGEASESGFTIGDMVDIMNNGRAPYTVEPNPEGHGILAFPPKGEVYDPSNKANTMIRGTVSIPAMRSSNFLDRASFALNEWMAKEDERVFKYYSEKLQKIMEDLVSGRK